MPGDSKPKRPKNGYFRYRDEVFDGLRKAHPTKKVTEISKMIATHYSELAPAKKEVYENAYKKELEKFRKANDQWKESHPAEKKGKKSRSRSPSAKREKEKKDHAKSAEKKKSVDKKPKDKKKKD